MCSPLLFESLLYEFHFPPLNDSNSFGSLDNVARISTKRDEPTFLVFISMINQEQSTIYHIYESERTRVLNFLAMSVQMPQLAGYPLTGNRSD